MNDVETLQNWLKAAANPPRDDKDYAIEFGEYLAKAAEELMAAINDQAGVDDYDGGLARADAAQRVTEAWRGLQEGVYEFRKRAARAGHEPSAIEFAK
jgi:hypothetical protein